MAAISGKTGPERCNDDQMHNRLLYLLEHMVGKKVTVSLKNGKKYNGIFVTANTKDDMGVVLRDVSSAEKGTDVPEMKFSAKQLVDVTADVNLNSRDPKSFKTDAEISSKKNVTERVLEKWKPEDDSVCMTLEDSSSGKRWDQFKVNEQMFGIETDFHEEIYTTKIDRSRPDYAVRKKEADRIAKEIESQGSSNPHVREERGMIDDSGMDEEDKYSSVQRPVSDNVYVPPASRDAANAAKAATVLSQDPAIISTQAYKGSQTVVNPDNSQTPLDNQFMGSLKEFVSGEKERVQQKKAHLKKEKDGRLQDLLKFSKNFKLKTPVPADLVPILAKDKDKQDEIVQRAAKEAADAKQQRKSYYAGQSFVTGYSIAPTHKPAQLNVKAMDFKPNPSAAAFVQASAKSPAAAKASAIMSPPLAKKPATISSIFACKNPKRKSAKEILSGFNPFTHAKRNDIAEDKFEKAYTCAPTWPAGEVTGDNSYKYLYPIKKFGGPGYSPNMESAMEFRPNMGMVPNASMMMQMNALYPQQAAMYGVPPMVPNVYAQPRGGYPASAYVPYMVQPYGAVQIPTQPYPMSPGNFQAGRPVPMSPNTMPMYTYRSQGGTNLPREQNERPPHHGGRKNSLTASKQRHESTTTPEANTDH